MKYKYEIGKRLKLEPTLKATIYTIIHRYVESYDNTAERYIIVSENNKDTRTIGVGNRHYEPNYLPESEIEFSKCNGKTIKEVLFRDGTSDVTFKFTDGSKLEIETDVERGNCDEYDEYKLIPSFRDK